MAGSGWPIDDYGLHAISSRLGGAHMPSMFSMGLFPFEAEVRSLSRPHPSRLFFSLLCWVSFIYSYLYHLQSFPLQFAIVNRSRCFALVTLFQRLVSKSRCLSFYIHPN